MAKRFTDTEKWGKGWFCKLSPMEKLVWLYLLDTCDHAGVWHGAFGRLGNDLVTSVSPPDLERMFSKQLHKISDEKYFIPSFVEFQYKLEKFTDLNPENKAHASVIAILRKYEIGDFPPLTPRSRPKAVANKPLLVAPCRGAKEKEQDKDKEQESDTDKDSTFDERMRAVAAIAGIRGKLSSGVVGGVA